MRYSTILYAQGCNIDGVDTRKSAAVYHRRSDNEDCSQYFANADLFSRRSSQRGEKVTGKLYSSK